MYNPANFSVNYAASSNYSNSSNYANGAGYADSLRVNGSVVDPNSLGIYIATYTNQIYENKVIFVFSCPGFTRTNGLKVILDNPSNKDIAPGSGNYNYVRINGLDFTLTGGGTRYGMYGGRSILYHVNGNDLIIVNVDFKYDCTSDCRCGDDGF